MRLLPVVALALLIAAGGCGRTAKVEWESPVEREHPLVGKELIGASIVLFGDNPFGWRAFTALAGTATVLGAFAFLWLLLGSMRAAVFGEDSSAGE